MMALTQKNVHYTLNSGQDDMYKSNRVHARIQEFLSGGGGGGGGGGSRPDDQKTVWTPSTYFTVYRVGPMVLLQRGGGGPTSSGRGGGSKETHIACDFPWGSGPPTPPSLDPHVGSPDATVCLQNHGLSKFK